MPEKLCDYLYYMELDDYAFDAMPQRDLPLFNMGCSSIRKGMLYGRNLDLPYCETPEFIIRVKGGEGRFSSIGVCADPTITCNAAEMTEAELRGMPSITNDGINENGVVAGVNVVNITGVDDMKGTAAGKEKIHASRIVRYLLDRAESAEHAAALLKEIDIVGGFMGYGLHWMIADAKDTFVAEIIHGELTVSRNRDHYMTNFYLNYGPVREKQSVAGVDFCGLPKLNDHAIGVERWCILRDGYEGIGSARDMARLLAAVSGSAMYDGAKGPIRYSDCIGGKISIASEREVFDAELNRQTALFEKRDRKRPCDAWYTWHSSVYDIEKQTLQVYAQEDYSRSFDFRR